jgi:hypothetical protein
MLYSRLHVLQVPGVEPTRARQHGARRPSS